MVVTMRKTILLATLALAACQAPVPDSNPQGAGFQDYNTYLRGRAAGMEGAPYGTSEAPVTTAPVSGFSPDRAAAAIDAASGGAPLSATAPAAAVPAGVATVAAGTALPPVDSAACGGRGNAFAGIEETTSEMNYAQGGVSDEQDFKAVTSRESIESDKERIACNRQQYVVVQPGAVPQRPNDEGPNIAAYALETTNPPGVKLYTRPPFYLTNPERACAKFTSSDKAQQAFLAAGGPQRDPKALDPDGDGFACAWDPRPFRAAK